MHETPSTPADKMTRYRHRLREQGLRPVQLWVPDIRDPAFVARVQKEVSSLSKARESDALAFIESAADLDRWQ